MTGRPGRNAPVLRSGGPALTIWVQARQRQAKKEPHEGALKYRSGNGGVLFRGFWVALAKPATTHGPYDTHFHWFVKRTVDVFRIFSGRLDSTVNQALGPPATAASRPSLAASQASSTSAVRPASATCSAKAARSVAWALAR